MLDELIKTVRLHLSERLTSPLFGAFAVSWCAWNYRTLFVLFSGEPVLTKFVIIDSQLYPTVWHALLRGVGAPLLTSALYLFAYPYPARWVYIFTRMRQRELLEIRRKIEDETPLTAEDSRRIRNELARAEQEYFTELDRRDREVEKLREQLAALQESSGATSSSSAENSKEELTPQMLRMLELVEKHGGKVLEDEAISTAGIAKIEAEFLFGELRKRNFIARVYDHDHGDFVFKFTHEGRAALLKHRSPVET